MATILKISNKNISVNLYKRFLKYAFFFIKKENLFKVVIPGGSTPKEFYKILQENYPFFEKTIFILSDERYVNAESENSNTKMIKSFLKTENIIYPDTSKEINLSAEEFSKKIEKIFPFHIAILGIGEDGHTASLFPNLECGKITNLVCITKAKDFNRISLTKEALKSSCRTIFLAKKEGKEGVLEKFLRYQNTKANEVINKKAFLITDF